MKNFLLFFLIFNSYLGLWANEESRVRTFVIQEGFGKGLEYTGEVDSQGKPHGKGKLKGTTALGRFVTGKGHFVHGQASGYCELTDGEGGKYTGEMKNSEKHGFGVRIYPNGRKYEGEWKNNLKHGKGTFYYPDGRYTKGTYRNNVLHGFAIMEGGADDYSYYGELVDGNFEGHGYIKWPNGVKYVGEWKDDKMHGHGCLTDPDGTTEYVGEFKNGQPVGLVGKANSEGKLIFIGKINQKGHSEGMIYEMMDPGTRKRYIGEKQDGKATGVGYLDVGEGNRKHIGYFLNNKIHGAGMTITETGQKIFGIWENNELVSEENSFVPKE